MAVQRSLTDDTLVPEHIQNILSVRFHSLSLSLLRFILFSVLLLSFQFQLNAFFVLGQLSSSLVKYGMFERLLCARLFGSQTSHIPRRS